MSNFRWLAQWDWSHLSTVDNKEKVYCLTEREAQALATVTRQMEWRTRWDVQPGSVDWNDAQAFVQQLNHSLANPCVTGSGESETCIEYFATDPIFTYLPAAPDEVPPNYQLQPFTVWRPDLSLFDSLLNQYGLDLQGVTGFEPGDVITTLPQFPAVNYTGINPIAWIQQWVDHVQNALTNGLPRITFDINGSGIVELHLVAVPLGGYALVGVDAAVNIVDLALDLITGAIGIADINSLIELNRDVFKIPPERGGEIIHEIEIDTSGAHTIDIVFIPAFDDSVTGFFGYGGGLRSVVLCGFDPVYPTNEGNNMPFDMRLNSDCVLQYRLKNPDGTIFQDWTDVGGWAINAASCFQGAPGPPGPPGADGDTVTIGQGGQILIDRTGDGIPDDVYEPPTNQPNSVSLPTGQTSDEKCNSAHYAAKKILEFTQKTVDDAASITLNEFLTASLGIGGFDGGALSQLWQYALTNLSGLSGIAFSSYQSTLTEQLYCNDLNRSAIDLSSIPATPRGAITRALDSVTDGKFYLWALVGQSVTSPIDCSSFCGNWCLDLGNQTMTGNSPEEADPVNKIVFNFPSNLTVDSAEVTCVNDSADTADFLDENLVTVQLRDNNVNQYSVNATIPQGDTAIVPGGTGDDIELSSRIVGSMTYNVKIYGTGTPPPGAGNC
jgi:hypothetical protein